MSEQSNLDIDAFVEEVLIWMEFEKIHSVMNHLNWKWGVSNHPPSIQEIKESCAEEIRRAYHAFVANEYLNLITGTGGWEVSLSRENVDSLDIAIFVRFVLTSWDNYL